MKTKTNEKNNGNGMSRRTKRSSGSIAMFYQDSKGGGPYYGRSYETSDRKKITDRKTESWYSDFMSC